MEKRIVKFTEAIRLVCDKSFPKQRTTKKAKAHKTVPWWTQKLTVIRKKTNAQCRLYQRTRNNDDLQEKCKAKYSRSKAAYAAIIKREKIRSWQEYCNSTTAANPWNAVYNLAKRKRHTPTQTSTLWKPDGTLTTDTKETMRLMLNHFTPKDKEKEDSDYHKLVRAQAREPINIAEDREFTTEEISDIIGGMDNRKAPGEDSITRDIYKSAYQILPKFILAMYNGCLRVGVFPQRWKRANIIPITEHGKEDSYGC
jgi:hypothetical protein